MRVIVSFLLVFIVSITVQAQFHVMTFGPDTSDGSYVWVIFTGNRAATAFAKAPIGSQEKASEHVVNSLKWDFNQTFFAIYDPQRSDSKNMVYVHPTWCTYTFDKDFSQVAIAPHRNSNRRVAPLCEYFIVEIPGYQNNNQININVPNTSIHSSSSNNNGSTTIQPTRKFKCPYCNGTGRIEKNDNAPASFGQSKANKKCSECGKIYDPTVFNHYHQQCRHCGGTGYNK